MARSREGPIGFLAVPRSVHLRNERFCRVPALVRRLDAHATTATAGIASLPGNLKTHPLRRVGPRMTYSAMELMICCAARTLVDGATVAVGTGVPCAAAML